MTQKTLLWRLTLTECLREADTGPPQKQSFCGVKSPSYKTLPPLLSKERGMKGVRLIDTILKEAKNQEAKNQRPGSCSVKKVVVTDLFTSFLPVS